MIQSDKFDSPKMNIKKIVNITLVFLVKRLIEILGIIILSIGLFLLISLISYSPSDPNFIFPDNTQIKNIFGFRGSYISDLFFQSLGLISYLIPFTLFFSGINIFIKKDFFLIIENIFYSIIYSILGSLFFSHYYKDTFVLYINGNGGFVGNYLDQSIINKLLVLNDSISFFTLIFLIIIVFLLSVNFNIKSFSNFLKKIINLFSKGEKNYTNKNEIINEYIPQEEIKNLIQEDLPFIKADEIKKTEKIKFQLPTLDLLKMPTKKERENSGKKLSNDPEFLEKILLDFGVNGNIKKVSHGRMNLAKK